MLVLKCRYGRTKSQLSSLQLVTPSGKNATSLAEVSWRSNEKSVAMKTQRKINWVINFILTKLCSVSHHGIQLIL